MGSRLFPNFHLTLFRKWLLQDCTRLSWVHDVPRDRVPSTRPCVVAEKPAQTATGRRQSICLCWLIDAPLPIHIMRIVDAFPLFWIPAAS
jgi:hypothetical protein